MAGTEQMEEFKFPDEKDTEIELKTPENELEIVVEDDTPPEDRDRTPLETPPDEPTEEELKAYSKDAQTRIKHFTKGYHDERRAREAAARERDEAVRVAQALVEENKKLKGSLSEGQNALVEQTKTALLADVEAARKELRDAHESFDPDKITEAQEKLLEAKIKLDRVNNFQPKTGQEEKSGTTLQQPPETKVVRPEPDQKALAWNQRNQWFGKDLEMSALAMGLHQKLVAEGVDPRSDDYYDRIERGVRSRFPEKFEDNQAPSRTVNKSPVAPASRSTAPKKITLTKTQVALANKLGVPLQEYARQVALEMRNQNA